MVWSRPRGYELGSSRLADVAASRPGPPCGGCRVPTVLVLTTPHTDVVGYSTTNSRQGPFSQRGGGHVNHQ